MRSAPMTTKPMAADKAKNRRMHASMAGWSIHEAYVWAKRKLGSTAAHDVSFTSPTLCDVVVPILFVPQMLFTGFFVAPTLIPVWLCSGGLDSFAP
jgi:hypothetical protein